MVVRGVRDHPYTKCPAPRAEFNTRSETLTDESVRMRLTQTMKARMQSYSLHENIYILLYAGDDDRWEHAFPA